MSSYRIIHDQKEIEKFEKFYSKSTENHERILFPQDTNTVQKYPTIIRYDNSIDHQRLYKHIQHYEILLGAYKRQKNPIFIPKEELALYTSINPRNSIHAT